MRFFLLLAVAVSASASTPDGSEVFASHCATCHHAEAEAGSRIPSRAELANLTPEQVMTALLRGKMTMQAGALSTNEIRAVALYASAKNFSSVAVDPAAGRCTRNPKFSPAWAIGTDGA